jgi:signal transduction histidine kinase
LLHGRPVWIESQEELVRRYPDLPVVVTPNRSYRIACLPLLVQGAPYGVLAFAFDDAPPLDADAKRFLNLIARHSGQALERLRLLKDLQETVRFNHMFTAILGHDLRNPLAAIMSSAYVAGKRDTDAKLEKPLSRIIKAGSRMARMIDQLLDFTRVRVGAGIPLQLATVDIVSLLETIIDELEGANAESKFELVAEGELRGLWDADRLCQVFSNLLGNAMAHGDRAHPVRVCVECTQQNQVRVSVHNEGAIPRDFLDRIFDPTVEASLRRERPSGLGLGLFISREITKAHGGSIEIHSTDADGTTFIVSLPRGEAPRQTPSS